MKLSEVNKDLVQAVQGVLEGKEVKEMEMKYPHDMFDPKTGKKEVAKDEAGHKALAAKGYTHEAPEENVADPTDKSDDQNVDKVRKMHGVKKVDLGEEVDEAHSEALVINEGRMKEFADYVDQGKDAAFIAKKMKLDLKTVKSLMASLGEAKTEEESDKQKKYKAFFTSALKKFGVKSPAELEDGKKKEFFDYVDANYEADGEVKEGVGDFFNKAKKKVQRAADKVTGGDIASSSNVLVTKVNPDNDNVNEIEVNQTTSVEDGVSLSFSPPFRSMTSHYTDSTTGSYAMEANSGGSIKSSFTITCTAGSGRPFSNPNVPTIDDLCVVKTVNIGSAALPIEGENVSSSTYYRWPVSNIVGLSDGMVLDPTRTSNAVIDSRIGGYLAEKSTNEIIEREYYNDVKTITINDINVDGVSASSNSVTAIDVYGAATAQEGNVTFDVQQPDALKSDTNVKLIGYGVDQIRTVTGANVELSNVTIELTQISTTTTSRTINPGCFAVGRHAPALFQASVRRWLSATWGYSDQPSANTPTRRW